MIYVPDNTSVSTKRPDWPRGIWIGDAKTGKVTGFIEDPDHDPKHNGFAADTVVTDAKGNLYTVEVSRQMVKVYTKK